MTYNEAIEYIHSVSWTFCKPGLDRIRELTEKLGNPEDSLKFIHVAGTNGKGSFCSMLCSVLRACGLKVGMFTSPYILRFNERMRIGDENIPDGTLARLTEKIKPIADSLADKPTEFELITAIALNYFREEKVDVVVFECGMGGRLDSTNVIKTPILSVITGIALDHTAFLGDTVEKIALEKAGIIKPGVPVLFGGENNSAADVIEAEAIKNGSRFMRTDYSKLNVTKTSLSETFFNYRNRSNIRISLSGLYQPKNASLVLDALDILSDSLPITETAIREGLSSAKWRARFEVIGEEPTVIFDGAHNPEGIAGATESIKRYFGSEKVIALTGVLKDKDYRQIAESISSVASHAFTITPDNPRALAASEYASVISKFGVYAEPKESIKEALSAAIALAKSEHKSVICLGSLYTYSEVVSSLNEIKSEH